MRLTNEAIVAIKYVMIKENIENFFFRVGIEGNELEKMGYAVEFVKTPDTNDQIIDKDGLKIVVNNLHKQYLQNLVIDYYEKGNKYGIIFKQE